MLGLPRACWRQLAGTLLATALAGCTTGTSDFVEVHGMFADGTAVNVHQPANAGRVPSLNPALGTLLTIVAPAEGPEDLGGFRIEIDESRVTAGGSYASDPNGPVVFYVAVRSGDGGAVQPTAQTVSGGTITLSALTPKITGTLANLVDSDGGADVLTIGSGSFSVSQP